MSIGVFLYARNQANKRFLILPNLLPQLPHRLRLHRIRRQCYQITYSHPNSNAVYTITANADKTPSQLIISNLFSAASISSLFILIIYHPFVVWSSKELVKYITSSFLSLTMYLPPSHHTIHIISRWRRGWPLSLMNPPSTMLGLDQSSSPNDLGLKAMRSPTFT